MEQFKQGEKVTMVFYGEPRYGVVSRDQRSGSTIVWVRWNVSQREGWTFAESLERIAA